MLYIFFLVGYCLGRNMDEILSVTPESIEELIELMTEDTYKSVKTAVELSKWEDGNRLTKEQLNTAYRF